MVNKKNIIGKIFVFLLFLLRPIFRLIWVKKIEGRQNLPAQGSFIIVANHQSYFDFISLYSLPGFRPIFLAAEKFWDSKFWRPIVEYTGQIKVERNADDKSKSINEAIDVLKKGGVLGIFPQGTRSRSGKIEKTYIGVAKIALATGAPVVPVGIRGAFRILPPHAKKPKMQKIIELHIGQPMFFDKKDFSDSSEQYRLITNKIMREISILSNKEYKEE